ncbi:MAG: chemotaxis protein CheA [Bacillota bacterium]|nr:chemotaxis protein CheA [Bacillota bacterium]
MSDNGRDPMLDMFIFETLQLVEQLEEIMLDSEKEGNLSPYMDQIFRNMHTIKGNSAMMLYENISKLAHSVEDLFDFLRQKNTEKVDYSKITDLVLGSIDFIKAEVEKIKNEEKADGDASSLIENIRDYLNELKQQNSGDGSSLTETKGCKAKEEPQKFYIPPSKGAQEILADNYEVVIHFKDGCGMENVRAFTVVHKIKAQVNNLKYYPENIEEDDSSEEIIKQQGFKLTFETNKTKKALSEIFSKVAFIDKLDIKNLEQFHKEEPKNKEEKPAAQPSKASTEKESSGNHDVLSVNVAKLDELMDLIGELVISEAMVTKNPELAGLQLDGFEKAARQLRKIVDNIQDTVMSMRLVPLSNTFRKMNRLVRDMNKKLDKKVDLRLIGEDTEVDKNVIEHISDPLMHLIRNSMDHGIEKPEERREKGKNEDGLITLEAKNAGGDVWIIIKDDGAGLDREKILTKAREHGLINKPEKELTDREIYAFIMLPGFSTKEKVTEFSGRGVGMDVVMKNIEQIRGNIYIDSEKNKGTTISIKIPLTLAIIDGMNVGVGRSRYTIPITAIKQSLKVRKEDVITDPDGTEMVLVRGECYPILRLHKYYKVNTEIEKIEDGIVVMVENEGRSICLFADSLLGGQQVVVKALPSYIKKVRAIAGCTLLGDGSISLILDIAKLFQ